MSGVLIFRWLHQKYLYGVWHNGQSWSCNTVDKNPFQACFWIGDVSRPLWITQECYNTLTDVEKAYARSYGDGMVSRPYFTNGEIPKDQVVECWSSRCRDMHPVDDPCKDVSCPDKCVGVDKYDGVCRDGVCVQGTLIEYNSEHCGYTPEPTPDPTPTPSSATYALIALMLAGTYMILRR